MAYALEATPAFFSNAMMLLPRIPIWQAPTGSIAGPELCAAVTLAGGVGAMGLTWTEPRIAAQWVDQVRRRTSGLFLVNFVLEFEPKGLPQVLQAGVPMITFSWGDPQDFAKRVKSSGAFLGIQVVSPLEAEAALRHEPDVLICQGIEAGGHVQSERPLRDVLPEILRVAGNVPVVAAGGIATPQQVRDVLGIGAAGAMLGTRFVASQESRAHPEYKRLLLLGSTTKLTHCFDLGWKNAKHRVLPNETLRKWEDAGKPTEPDRPGEGDVVATSGSELIYRYEDTAPQDGMKGDIEAMCLYAGTGLGEIEDIPTAAELVARLAP